VRAMDVGDWHVIALLEDGTVRCWGDNRRGQCSVPLGLSGVLAVQAAGGWSDSGHCAVILNDGTVVAWGSNQYGETSVPPGLTARYLSSGHRHLVAITGDPDCNGDGMYDTAQIADGTLLDNNRNGIPDTCECFADINDDGTVNGADISVLLGYWGQSGKNVVGDITGDGIVNGADLAQLLGSWGPCQ
jgi:alpha-tubulin suppressor-like RCC1 family protein